MSKEKKAAETGSAEIAVFTKEGGPLTKRISLNRDGTINSDGSGCRPPGQQLTTDEIIQKVIEIIGKNEHGHYKASAFDIEVELRWIKDTAENIARTRSRLSKESKRAIKKFAAFLRKRVGDLPKDFVVASGLLSLLCYSEGYAGAVIKPKRGDAIEKELAMEAALHLCEKFKIEPTGTRDGSACKIGAILCGDENADLRKHYVAVRSERRRLQRGGERIRTARGRRVGAPETVEKSPLRIADPAPARSFHVDALPPIKKLKDDGPDAMAEYRAKQQAELDKAARLRAIRLAKKPSA
jgi:hypothetical protein